MAVYTALSDFEIGAFLSRYTIGTLVSAKGITEGVENTNYLLTAEKDGVQTRYILTVYEKRTKEEDLPFFAGLKQHLAARGVTCPVPILDAGGNAIGRIKDKAAMLVSFLAGKSTRAIQNVHMSELGAHMARMHLAVADFAGARANALSLAGWRSLVEKIESRADEIAPGLGALLAGEMQWLEKNWPNDLPTGVIHADLFPDNVFYEGERLSGIIDFYFACNDILVYDLAIVINAWSFERQREFNITKAQQLLKAYNNVRPISDAELNAFPILCRGSALRFLLTRAYDWLNPVAGAQVSPKDPMEYVKKLRFHQSVSHHREYGL